MVLVEVLVSLLTRMNLVVMDTDVFADKLHVLTNSLYEDPKRFLTVDCQFESLQALVKVVPSYLQFCMWCGCVLEDGESGEFGCGIWVKLAWCGVGGSGTGASG